MICFTIHPIPMKKATGTQWTGILDRW